MKLYAYINNMTLEIIWKDRPQHSTNLITNFHLLGAVEVQEPKKTVTKEAEVTIVGNRGNMHVGDVLIPPYAKDIKCTYKVEE
jgi:hypothetical protein